MIPQIVAATLALLGAHPASLPAAGRSPPVYGPGEQLTYSIRYLGVEAGTALITVGESAEQGHAIWPIVALANSGPMLPFFPVHDKFVTYLNPASSLGESQVLYADENHKRREQRFVLDRTANAALVTRQKPGEPAVHDRIPIAPLTQDLTAATFQLRNSVFAVGQVLTIPVFTGMKSFSLQATVLSRQNMRTVMGPKEVFKVRVRTGFSGKFQSNRDMFAYMTTDASHVLVRIEADFLLGTLVAELKEYKQGRVIARAADAPKKG